MYNTPVHHKQRWGHSVTLSSTVIWLHKEFVLGTCLYAESIPVVVRLVPSYQLPMLTESTLNAAGTQLGKHSDTDEKWSNLFRVGAVNSANFSIILAPLISPPSSVFSVFFPMSKFWLPTIFLARNFGFYGFLKNKTWLRESIFFGHQYVRWEQCLTGYVKYHWFLAKLRATVHWNLAMADWWSPNF
jgi:hypothetical protein